MSILDDIYAKIGGADGQYAGVTYGLVPGNSLLQVVQTPDLWGTAPDSTGYYTGPTPPGQNLLAAIQSVVQTASSVVDITTLAPFPDGAFLAAIRDGLHHRAAATPLLLRIHAGLHPLLKEVVFGRAAVEAFLRDVTEGLPPDAPITVAVSLAMMSSVEQSWNHGKVVAADGQQVIFGGHNMWAGDYLGFAPVHDLSLQVAGPAAAMAHVYSDRLWAYVADWYASSNPAARVWSMVWANGQMADGLPPARPEVAPEPVGAMRALVVTRMGRNVVPPDKVGHTDQASDLAKVQALEAATTSIKLSQQDMAFSLRGAVGKYATFADWLDPPVVDALAAALQRGVQVELVVSGHHARSATGNPYANLGGVTTKAALVEWFRNLRGMTSARLQAMVARLHVKELHTVRTNFNPWKQGLVECVQANHAKVYIIDDAVAYVGSDNLYPCSLQEFGMLIEDDDAVHGLLDAYWTKLWDNAHPVPS